MNSYVFGAIGIVGAVMIWMIAYFASYSERTDARGSGDYTDARPAGLWIRFFARMADRLVYELIVCFVFIAAMVLDATLLSTTAALLIVLIAFVVVPLAYFTILTARTGRTWGKMLAGVTVERSTGGPIGWGRAFLRALSDLVFQSLWLYGIGLLDLVFLAATRRRRALHDMIADSRVVRTDYTPSRALPWLAILAWLTPFVMVFGVIRPFIAQAFYMASTSMEPTIRQNDHVLVDRLAYKLGPLRRDDIVVYTTPKKAVSHFNEAANASCLARVAALPGDTVEVRARGEVIVNGKMVGAPSSQALYGLVAKPPFRVADGECLVLGDNHDSAYDGRFWGTLPVKNVIGRVTLIYAPRLQAFDRE